MRNGHVVRALALSCVMALAACEISNSPLAPTDGAVEDPQTPTEPTLSAASKSLTDHYLRVQNGLISRGLLRIDGGGADTPFDAEMLVRNFENIALSEEHVLKNGRLLPGRTGTQVNRWRKPVRVALHFADTVEVETETGDRSAVSSYLTRLSSITGHPIYLVADRSNLANFNVLVLHEDQRRDLASTLLAFGLPAQEELVTSVESLRTSDDCIVVTWDENANGEISRSFVFIRAELPDLMRKACYQEEIAQGLGLFNDYPRARPSIFNDDDEFAFLTAHDERLLEMLYDRRMSPGLTAEEAREKAAIIAGEFFADGS